ncbi:hypothetical protein ONZ45_g4762 [Pleurotus djamor]|nr:hypothetical protein ONZ45_g4762 [Pleurotus djamor]
MAYLPSDDETRYSIHPGLIVLITFITLVPFVVFAIYRRHVWFYPLLDSLSHSRRKRRYEADKRYITENWGEIKREIGEHDLARHHPTQSTSSVDNADFPLVALPKLPYSNLGNTNMSSSSNFAQPLQRGTNVPPASPHTQILYPSVPPPAYSPPRVTPFTPAATHSMPQQSLAPSRRSSRLHRVKQSETIGNPFYPTCVNNQLASGHHFDALNNGRRIV